MKSIKELKDFSMAKAPEKILLFGEGNFLRAFIGSIVEEMNLSGGYSGSIVVLQGTPQGLCDLINEQNGVYTVLERGAKNGAAVEKSRVVHAVSRCINPYINYDLYLKTAENPEITTLISNTTEFGIRYEAGVETKLNYPAKLTEWLHTRYEYFGGEPNKGVCVLPCELIDRNGDKLYACVKKYAEDYAYGDEFLNWLETACNFCNTLVDRIVSGYPKTEAAELCAKLGYEDNLLDVCEPFLLWVIERGKGKAEIPPFALSGFDVIVTDDLEFYRTRKVRILNGSHTASALAGILAGLETVEQVVSDKRFKAYLDKFLQTEVIPNIAGDMQSYAKSVYDRFLNPFLNHRLRSIALNSVSKYKARVLVSAKDCIKRGYNPIICAFALAALLAYYKNETETGEEVAEEARYVERLKAAFGKRTGAVEAALSDVALWDEDLTAYGEFSKAVEKYYSDILKLGVYDAMQEVL